MKSKSKDYQKGGVTRRTFLKTAGMAGIAVSTVGFPAVLRGAKPKEILIGSIHPITGFCAYDGTSLAQAVQLAVDKKNAAGGIKSMGGAKIKVLLKDTESKPKVGESAATKLIRDGCVALLGCYNSPVTIVTTKVAEMNKIPHIITVAVADEILQRGFKYTFRVQPDTAAMAEYTTKYIRELSDKHNMNLKTIAFLHLSGFGSVIAKKVTQVAPKLGFEIIGSQSYGYGVSDLSTEVAKIKDMKSDVIVDVGYLADGILKLKTYDALKVEPRGGIFGCANGGFSNPASVKNLGRVAEYLMDGNYWMNPISSFAQSVKAEYNKRYTKVVFQPHCAPTYDATLVLFDALERARSTDPEKLREAIAQTSLSKIISPGGPVEFGATGQNKNALPTLMQVQDREVKVVLPEKYANAKPRYPVPPRSTWS